MLKMADQQWRLPPIQDILDEPAPAANAPNVLRQKRLIEHSLAELGFEVQVHQIRQGPRATQFSLGPGADVQVSKIKNLEADLAVALSGAGVNIVDPTPEHPYLGILVSHPAGKKNVIRLRQMLESPAFEQKQGHLKVGLGINIIGVPVVISLTEMPHLLIGGTTGSGKSTCLHAVIAGLLCTYPPTILQFLMIDPLVTELRNYTNLPHLFAPVVTRSGQALDTLTTLDSVIDRRYKIFAQHRVRDIATYNQKVAQIEQEKMAYIVVAIDNVFDLMMTEAKEVEQVISRLAQRARGAGVHIVLSTPRAGTDVLAGTIKANFPGRIAFRVINRAESQLILDSAGAEELLDRGEMLYKGPNTNQLQRVQSVYVSEAELKRITDFWRSN